MVLIRVPKLRQFEQINPLCKGRDFGGNFWVTGSGNTIGLHWRRTLVRYNFIQQSSGIDFCIFES